MFQAQLNTPRGTDTKYTSIIVRVTVALMKHHDQKQPGKQRGQGLTLGRSQGHGGVLLTGLLPEAGLLSWLSYRTQYPGVAPPTNGLGHPPLVTD